MVGVGCLKKNHFPAPHPAFTKLINPMSSYPSSPTSIVLRMQDGITSAFAASDVTRGKYISGGDWTDWVRPAPKGQRPCIKIVRGKAFTLRNLVKGKEIFC